MKNIAGKFSTGSSLTSGEGWSGTGTFGPAAWRKLYVGLPREANAFYAATRLAN